MRRFRVYAAARNQSMTALMTEAIRRIMDENDSRAKSKRRFLRRIQNASDRGTKGVLRWTRGEIHER